MTRVLVDSSSDYTVEEAKAKNIDMVHISITIGDNTYADGIDLGRGQFYEILQESSDFPKTSQPSPQDFLDIFMNVKEKGDDLVCILLSSGLSGTFQSASLAKQMAGYDNIYLIDSLSATYTIKIMADYACHLRANGMPARDIAGKIEALKSKVKVVAALDTLEFLARGGRINKKIAALGDMANIKPIITIAETGEISVLGKCLGKNKAINHILTHLQGIKIDKSFPIYSIYSYGTENCRIFEERLKKENYPIEKTLQIGSTIGTHIGPEAFGIVFVTT